MQYERTIALEGAGDGLSRAVRFLIDDRLAAQIYIVPGERVYLAGVDLPIRSRNQRLAALGFALEEQLAQPVSEIHAALGPAMDGNRYVAAVVDAKLMSEWVARAATEGAADRSIVPDTALLPIPPAGRLTHLRVGDRNLVRCADGGGFVATEAQFRALWERLGRPGLDLLGEEPLVTGTQTSRISPGGVPELDPSLLLDLRQGRFARRTTGNVHLKMAAALLVGLGLVHTAIAGADVLAIGQTASAREALLVEEFRARFPQTPPGTELHAAIDQMALAGSGPDNTFLSLLSTVSATLPQDLGLSVNQMTFDTANGQLDLSAEAGAMKDLEDAGTALRAVGLTAELGATRIIDGGAEGNLAVKAGSAS